MKKILFVSSTPETLTGYGKVNYYLTQALINHYDIYVYTNDCAVSREIDPRIKILRFHTPADPFGKLLLGETVKLLKPDYLFIYTDIEMSYLYLQNIKKAIPDFFFKIILYLDILYTNIQPNLVSFLENHCDLALVFTSFQYNLLKDTYSFSKPLRVLSHGIDKTLFFQIDKTEAKKKLGIPEDSFCIVAANRNNDRKRYDILVRAFATFCSRLENSHVEKKYPILIFNCHTNTSNGWKLDTLCDLEFGRLGMDFKKYVVFHPKATRFTDEEINLLYNATDVSVNTADAEGFGLVSAEQAYLGKPVIAGRHTGLGAIFGNSMRHPGRLIEPTGFHLKTNSGDHLCCEGYLIPHEKVTEALMEYYNFPKLIELHGTVASKIMQSERYSWDHITHLFLQHVSTV